MRNTSSLTPLYISLSYSGILKPLQITWGLPILYDMCYLYLKRYIHVQIILAKIDITGHKGADVLGLSTWLSLEPSRWLIRSLPSQWWDNNIEAVFCSWILGCQEANSPVLCCFPATMRWLTSGPENRHSLLWNGISVSRIQNKSFTPYIFLGQVTISPWKQDV